MSIKNFSDWSKTNVTPKVKKINEGLLSRFFGGGVSIDKVCEKIRGALNELGSDQQDAIMIQLENKFGRGLSAAIDNGWTSEDFARHAEEPAVKALAAKASEINDWVDSNLTAF